MLIFVVIPESVVISQTQDTIPPVFSWLSPKQFDMLSTDTIRLSVDAHDNENGSGIKKVVFSVQYMNEDGRTTQKEIIAEVDTFPYELLWDCSNLPDQDWGKLLLHCEVTDNNGNVSENPNQPI